MNVQTPPAADGGSAPPVCAVVLATDALDRLMPMALIVSSTGHIRHVGPTLARLRPARALAGTRLLEVFELRRPHDVTCFADLVATAGAVLHLRFRDAPATALTGQCVPLAGGAGVLVNLSFGIGAVEALGVYDLTGADFPPTDLTVELLYLAEANAAIRAESLRLTRRLQGARHRAEELSQTDALTGLANRRAMEMVLDRYRAARERFGLMQLDLDFFKQVNDEQGHAAGDEVLRAVAAILREETREQDTVVRAGGDEFVLVFHRLTDAARLAGIARRLLLRLEQPIPYGGAACRISGSIGIVVSTDYAAPDPERMLQDADAALYASKKAGRARYCFAGRDAAPARPEP